MAEIELSDVTKRYPDGTEAVKHIDLTIHDGELMILVGPSGCGKTTTLRMIAGLEEITSGTLRIGDRVVNNLAPKDRDIAMVFQNYALYPHMTVKRNMGFALKLAKVKAEQIDRRVASTAGILDLLQHVDRKPANLSGGQRQRVAMGRAIVREPQAFLMDEPLSNLDAQLRVQTRIEVARLQQRLGTTTVYVTHDQVEAMTLGHRVAVMHEGLIQQVDTPQGLYNDPANLFVARFIGSPPINLLPARLTADTVRLPFGDVAVSGPVRERLAPGLRGKALIAGLRPEVFSEANGTVELQRSVQLTPTVDVVELLGSDVYAYFDVECPEQLPTALLGSAERRAATLGARHRNSVQVVARLPPGARVGARQPTTLAVDPSGLMLFDPETGRSVLRPPSDPPGRDQVQPLETSAGTVTDPDAATHGPV